MQAQRTPRVTDDGSVDAIPDVQASDDLNHEVFRDITDACLAPIRGIINLLLLDWWLVSLVTDQATLQLALVVATFLCASVGTMLGHYR